MSGGAFYAAIHERFTTPPGFTEGHDSLRQRRAILDGATGRAGDDLAPEHSARRRLNARNRIVVLPPDGHGSRWAGAPEAHR